MAVFTEKQKACIVYFKQNIDTWLKDDLKKGKYVVIADEKTQGIYDSFGNAFDYAFANFKQGDFIIQEIFDKNDVVSFLSPAVVE